MARIPLSQPSPGEALRPKSGAKATRSETVTVRLDPRLNYLCELAARAQRRTKSSFIEWAVEAALKSVSVPGTATEWGQDDRSVDSLANELWDVDETDRLVALAYHAPILMTHDEQVWWKAIKEHGYFWRGSWWSPRDAENEEWQWNVAAKPMLVMDRVRKHLDLIKMVSTGDDPEAKLPSFQSTRKKSPDNTNGGGGFVDDLDDDIPF